MKKFITDSSGTTFEVISTKEAFINTLVETYGDDFKYIKKLLNYNGYRVTKEDKRLIEFKIEEGR